MKRIFSGILQCVAGPHGGQALDIWLGQFVFKKYTL
jgi:hypothetical protein